MYFLSFGLKSSGGSFNQIREGGGASICLSYWKGNRIGREQGLNRVYRRGTIYGENRGTIEREQGHNRKRTGAQ